MNDLFITPNDELTYDVAGHKIKTSPITVKEYMEYANLFENFNNLNAPQQDKFRKFVGNKIVSVDGKEFDKNRIHDMKPGVFIQLLTKMVDQLNLKEVDKTFHTGAEGTE